MNGLLNSHLEALKTLKLLIGIGISLNKVQTTIMITNLGDHDNWANTYTSQVFPCINYTLSIRQRDKCRPLERYKTSIEMYTFSVSKSFLNYLTEKLSPVILS